MKLRINYYSLLLLLFFATNLIAGKYNSGKIVTEDSYSAFDGKSSNELSDMISREKSNIETLKKKNDNTGIFEIYNHIGDIYLYQTDYENARINYNNARNLASKLGDNALAESFYRIALINKNSGNQKQALKDLLISKNIMTKDIKNEVKICIYLSLSDIYDYYNDFNRALIYDFEAKKLINETTDLNCRFTVYHSLINTFQNADMRDSALQYSYLLAQIAKSEIQRGYAGSSIGACLINLGRDNDAIDYLKKSIQIFEKIQNKVMLISLYHAISTAYYNLNNVTDALTYSKKALDLSNNTTYEHWLPNIYYLLGQIKFIEQNYVSSLDLSYKGLEYAKKYKLNDLKVDLLSRISIDYAFLNKTESANEYHMQCYNQSSENLVESRNKLNTLINEKINTEMLVENQFRDKENTATGDSFLFKIILISIALVLFACSIIYTRFYYKRKLKKEEQKFNNSYLVNEKVLGIINNDIKKLMIPISLHLAETSKDNDESVKENYEQVAEKLNEIIYEVNKI